MTFFKTSLIRKSTLFLVAAIFSSSVLALDFNQTQMLANQGNAEAQTNLALMYDKGEGTREDNAKAIEWYTNEPPRDCRRLNFLREYDNENTKLYP